MEVLVKFIPVCSDESSLKEPIIIEKDVTIGRGAENDITIQDTALSRLHCRVMFVNGRCLIEDGGSRNGTLVNKGRISGKIELNDDDEIIIGKSIFRIEICRKEATVVFDSVSLSSQEKSDATDYHDSEALSEKFSGPSPVSMELDRRLIDDFIDEENEYSTPRKGLFNLRATINEKMKFQTMIFHAWSFMKGISSHNMRKIPWLLNLVVLTFIWFAVTGYAILARQTAEETGVLSLFYPADQTLVLFRALFVALMMLVTVLACMAVLSAFSWLILRAFRFNYDYYRFFQITALALSPAIIVMSTGSVLTVLFQSNKRAAWFK